jgi:hypothetical protein
VRGDKQIAGVDYFETYAPVVSWSIVWLLLVIAIIFDLSSVQVDYVNAVAQGNLEEDIFIEMPKGFTIAGADGDYVLKLRKSLYGLVQSPKNFSRNYQRPYLKGVLLLAKSTLVCLYTQPCFVSFTWTIAFSLRKASKT